MHSTTSMIVAALAAAAYASPMGGYTASQASSYAPYPTSTGWASGSGSGHPGNTSVVSTYSTALGVATASPNPSPVPGLVGKLLTDDTTVARFKDIQGELDAGAISLKFDFNPAANPGIKPGAGGQVDLANRQNFPILTDLGISAAGIFFEPCGLNTPHIHPRASEFLTLVTDSTLLTGFVLENGLTSEFNTTLTQFQGTVFPMGSVHFQQNLGCDSAVAIAGLNSEDPGASSLAQTFIGAIDPAVVEASLFPPKQIDASNFAQFKQAIPPPLALGIEECLIRCHIPY